MSEQNGTIKSREEFFQPRPRSTAIIELPDMGKAVYVLKGTWRLLQELDAARENATQDGEKVLSAVALLLATSEGDRICQNPEDMERLKETMTLADQKYLLDQWAILNGVAAESKEAIEKN